MELDLYKWRKEDELTEFSDNADALIKETGEPVKILHKWNGAYWVETVDEARYVLSKKELTILKDGWK